MRDIRTRLAQHRILLSFDQSKVPASTMMPPSECMAARNFVSECTTMSAHGRSADQVGRRQRVVDNQRHARLAGDGGDRLDIGNAALGLAIDSMKMALVCGVTARSKLSISSGSAHTTFQPKLLKAWLNWLIERHRVARGDEFVAGHQQLLQHDDLRGMS